MLVNDVAVLSENIRANPTKMNGVQSRTRLHYRTSLLCFMLSCRTVLYTLLETVRDMARLCQAYCTDESGSGWNIKSVSGKAKLTFSRGAYTKSRL